MDLKKLLQRELNDDFFNSIGYDRQLKTQILFSKMVCLCGTPNLCQTRHIIHQLERLRKIVLHAMNFQSHFLLDKIDALCVHLEKWKKDHPFNPMSCAPISNFVKLIFDVHKPLLCDNDAHKLLDWITEKYNYKLEIENCEKFDEKYYFKRK